MPQLPTNHFFRCKPMVRTELQSYFLALEKPSPEPNLSVQIQPFIEHWMLFLCRCCQLWNTREKLLNITAKQPQLCETAEVLRGGWANFGELSFHFRTSLKLWLYDNELFRLLISLDKVWESTRGSSKQKILCTTKASFLFFTLY